MDVLERTQHRLVLADKQSLKLLFGWAFVGGSGILAGVATLIDSKFLGQETVYFIAAAVLLVVGLGLLMLMGKETYAVFDNDLGMVEIQRKQVLGKNKVERYALPRITDVRTRTHGQNERKWWLELELDNQKWISLTDRPQGNPVARQSLEPQIRGYVAAARSPL